MTGMQRLTATAWLLAVGSLAGCARSTDGRLAVWWPFAGPALAAPQPAQGSAPATHQQPIVAPGEHGQPAIPAAGQVAASRPQTPLASAPAGLPDATDPAASGPQGTTIEGLVTQLRESGALDAAAEAQLRADLARTDPALWPLVAQQLRATAAYRRQADAPTGPHEHPARPVATSEFPQPTALQPAPPTGPTDAAPVEVLAGADVFGDEPPPPTAFASDSSPGEGSAAHALLPPEQRLPAAPAQARPPVMPPEGAVSAPSLGQRSAPQNNDASAGAPPAPAPPAVVPQGSEVPAGLALGSAQSSLQPPAVLHFEQPAAGAQAPAAVASSQPAAPASPLAAPASPAVQAAYVSAPASQSAAAWPDPLAQAIAELEQQTQGPARNADEIRAHAALRLLYLSAGRRDDALRPIPGLPAGQQDFWLEELYGLWTLLDSQQIVDPAKRAVEARRHLDRALHRLADSAELLVYNLAFCTEVTSFGVYEETGKSEFRAGEEVLLYAEVENFRSEETEQGYHTALRSSYQILDAQGRRVTSQDFNVMEEHCQNPRRDFFVRYFLQMPERIYPGEYTLELTIEDGLSQKLGSGRIPFTVVE